METFLRVFCFPKSYVNENGGKGKYQTKTGISRGLISQFGGVGVGFQTRNPHERGMDVTFLKKHNVHVHVYGLATRQSRIVSTIFFKTFDWGIKELTFLTEQY